MRGLSPESMIRVWEDGVGRHPTDRALAILRATAADPDWTVLADLPLGARDRWLLEVRERTFGTALDAVTACPRCGACVELHFSTTDVIARADGAHGSTAVEIGGRVRAIRALTSRDLASAARCATPDEARRVLAARSIEPVADPQAPDALSDADVEAIADALERVDPDAVRTLDVTCPDCHVAWEGELDVAEFLWTEIEAAAIRLLRDIHAIARAYGWAERDILAMTAQRRRAYVELVQ